MNNKQRDSKGRFIPGNTIGHRFKPGEDWDGNAKGRPHNTIDAMVRLMEQMKVPNGVRKAYNTSFGCDPLNMSDVLTGQLVHQALNKKDVRAGVVLLKMMQDINFHQSQNNPSNNESSLPQEITVNVVTTRRLPNDPEEPMTE